MTNIIWNWKTIGAIALTLTFLPVFGANEKNYTYLALGDSVAFGVDPTLFPPFSRTLPGPDDFIGYPERVATFRDNQTAKKLGNAACPGESSASFLVLGARDLGCNGLGPQLQPPWKPTIGLKMDYSGTQMRFAEEQLRTNKHINLVTLSIGGNDLSLLQADCANSDRAAFELCVMQKLVTPTGEPGELLVTYASNLTQILSRIRRDYKGTLVLLTYYSPSVDPLVTAAVAALNGVMTGVGAQFEARIANGFLAFRLASAMDNFDPCKAKLLIQFPDQSCDIHPSEKGRDLLAAAVLEAAELKIKRVKAE